jgi:hypothetical protein
MVGDSTMSVIRFVPASQVALDDLDAIVDGEPCRRLVFPSCRSNTTLRVPNTAYEAIVGTPGSLDAVVIMTGYNDWFDDFGAAFDTIVGAARAKGARHVVWLTYVEGGSSPTALRAYQQNNRDLRAVAANVADVTVADWNGYSRRGPWMAPDGVHLTPLGAYALADYIARFVAHVEGRPCHDSGATACENPDVTPTPDLHARYGV